MRSTSWRKRLTVGALCTTAIGFVTSVALASNELKCHWAWTDCDGVSHSEDLNCNTPSMCCETLLKRPASGAGDGKKPECILTVAPFCGQSLSGCHVVLYTSQP